jgi:hypothetical protein
MYPKSFRPKLSFVKSVHAAKAPFKLLRNYFCKKSTEAELEPMELKWTFFIEMILLSLLSVLNLPLLRM